MDSDWAHNHASQDLEFKESLSRFKKALFRTVVYKRENVTPSDEDPMGSSALDWNSGEQSLGNSEDWPLGESLPSLEQGKTVEVEERNKGKHRGQQGLQRPAASPIQTSPRHLLETQPDTNPKCTHCKSLQTALHQAHSQIESQQRSIASLSSQHSSQCEELAKCKFQYDSLQAQHLSSVTELHTSQTNCQELRLQCSELQTALAQSEAGRESLRRELERLKARIRRSGEMDRNRSFDKEPRLHKSPSLSRTANSRRSESLKVGSSSQDRHIGALPHSPISVAQPRTSTSPRNSPAGKKHRLLLHNARQRLVSALQGGELARPVRTPKKLSQIPV